MYITYEQILRGNVYIYQRIQSEYKPSNAKEFHKRLGERAFLVQYEHIIKEIIDSNEFWNRLRQRVDFLAYSAILKHGGDVCPHEIEPLNADCLFSLVEDDLKRQITDTEAILVDGIFQQYVRCTKGHFKLAGNYDYFTAPYFSRTNESNPDQGTIWLDQLTEDLFDKPLDVLVERIIRAIEE